MPRSQGIIILHGEDAMVAGIVTPFLFGPHKVATELAWWVNPEKRGTKIGAELLDAFEYWAQSVGCSLVTLVALGDTVGKYYEKRNYSLRENVYMKELT